MTGLAAFVDGAAARRIAWRRGRHRGGGRQQRRDAAPHELVALQPQNGSGGSLARMTIAREETLPGCLDLSETLRAGDNGEDTARPTLACNPPGKLVCNAGDPLDGSD